MTTLEIYMASLAVFFFGMWWMALNETQKKSRIISRLQAELNHLQKCMRLAERLK